MVVTHAGPDNDAFDSHLLCYGVNPRRPPVRVAAMGELPLGSLTCTTSAIPLP